MATRIYTRTGDGGKTGLFRGGRVSKSDLRVEAYGTIDELNAALGLALAHGPSTHTVTLLSRVQSLLFEVGADLATPPEVEDRPGGVCQADVDELENAIDEIAAKLPPLRSFVVPGGPPAAAALHLARSVCRRAERRCVALRKVEPATSELHVKLINRLSDLLFVLARRENHEAGAADSTWQSR